ncbi:DctP family TRAP transporter solute-binding subunit [Ammoniphilus sp. YIM 78166]|uniref:TRAP transporter substrate-binding protein n=1 Tax=Ammoniphilus sp. YIM 78166 TaxID=1644106 RepID=UPI00142FB5AF|nr:DctP family TRAP transporter solute-binding subunit [Ammoniphilus sp. YIM 78166]
MIKRSFLGVLAISLMVAITGCGGSDQPTATSGTSGTSAPSTEFTFKLGHLQGGDHPYQKGAEKFKDLVEQNSNGRIKVDIFPSSQLGNGRDQIEGLQMGSIQLHVGSVAPVANFAPKMNVLSMPYLFDSREHAVKVLDGEIGAELSKDLESKGIVNLAFWENGYRHMTNNTRPIKSANDAAGLKVRVQESPVYISMIKALGSTPTPIPFGELYTAMEQKVVDSQENPLAQIATNKFNEVQKHLTLTAHTYDAAVFLMSKMALDKLPADLQQVVKDAAMEAGAYEREVSKESESKFLQQLKDSGMAVEEKPDLDSFRQAVVPVYEELQDQYGGKELIDRIKNMK